MVKAYISLAILFHLSGPACAGQDIVYSARYYCPPSVQKTSHTHLYRIDSSGQHRMQLTFGRDDDYDVHWSPNGRLIAFMRYNWDLQKGDLMVVDPNGRRLRRIVGASDDDSFTWSADSEHLCLQNDTDPTSIINSVYDLTGRIENRNQWTPGEEGVSPDGRHRFLSTGYDDLGEIIDTTNGKTVARTSISLPVSLWISNSEIVGVHTVDENGDNPENAPALYDFVTVGLDGTVINQVALTELHRLTGFNANYAGFDGYFDRIDPWPGKRGTYLAWENWHNSTVGTDYGLYYLNPSARTLKFLSESQFAAWSPNHMEYCTAPGRVTSNYALRKDGTERTVWTAPLQIVKVPTGKMTTIQGGLLIVDSADWR